MLGRVLEWLATAPRPLKSDELRAFRMAMAVFPIAMLLHATFFAVFLVLGSPPLGLQQGVSALIWLFALSLVRRGHWRAAMFCGAGELMMQAAVGVHVAGWRLGLQYFLLFGAAINFLFPVGRRWAMLAVGAETLVLIAVYVYDGRHAATWHTDPRLIVGLGSISLMLICILLALQNYYFVQVVGRIETQLEQEHGRSEMLLHNVLPAPIAERLKLNPSVIADQFEGVTVLFADVVGFTPLAEELGPEKLVTLLDELFTAFDDLAGRLGIEKIKTIGDAYMAVAGLPVPRVDHARAAAELALQMRAVMDALSQKSGRKLGLRIGLASGPVVAGVIGARKFAYDLWGDTVNTAARMESHGVPGEIQLAPATAKELQGFFDVRERGEIEVKGKGIMRTWLLVGETKRATA
jgi:class 3 adenylate cyclase